MSKEALLKVKAMRPFGKIRDWVAWAICQFALKYIATDWYEAMIGGAIRLGMDKAREDA